MAVFDIDSFDPKRNYVIEASAGTGKTYNIVQIVSKIVNSGEAKLNELLIVTYTEAAASELKDRIRAGVGPIDNASIYTIHSFCQNAIKEFGLSAKLPLNLDVVSEDEVSDFADIFIREGEILKCISLLCSSNWAPDIEDLKDGLIDGVKKYYLSFDYQEDKSVITLLKKENAKDLIKAYSKAKTATKIEDYFDIPDFEKHWRTLETSTSPKCIAFKNALLSLVGKCLSFNGNNFKEDKSLSAKEKEAFAFFKDVKSAFKERSFKMVCAAFLEDFYIAYQQDKEKKKRQTFGDMIRYVREAVLGHSGSLDFLNRLKGKYKIGIIDEFQDTNQRQFDIFGRIFLSDDNHRLIVVGDPKQSIYSFQGADVSVYQKAKKEIIENGGFLESLKKNYRSTADMVKACNALFKGFTYDINENKEIIPDEHFAFEDSDYLSLDERTSDEKTGEFRCLFNGSETKPIWMAGTVEGIDPDDFARIAAQQIIECCEKVDGKTRLQVKDRTEKQYRDVSFSDFVVLVRTRSESNKFRNAFDRTAIPYVFYKDQTLFKGRECAHWIALLEAIDAPDFTNWNRKAFKKALFTSFFGLSLKESSGKGFDKDDTEQFALLNKWRDFASERKWEDMIDAILSSASLFKSVGDLKSINSFAKIRQIGSYCADCLCSGSSIPDVIRRLKNLSRGGNEDDDEEGGTIVEKGSDFPAVRIMTCHSSKGLQFPVVIGACGFKHKKSDEAPYVYHDENGNLTLSYGDSKTGPSEAEEEFKRLFYVAYTRAQYLMILPRYFEYGLECLEQAIPIFVEENPGYIKPITDNGDSAKKSVEKASLIIQGLDLTCKETTNAVDQTEEITKLAKKVPSCSSYSHSYCSLSHPSKKEVEYDDEGTLLDKEGSESEGLSQFDKDCLPCKDVSYDKDISPVDIPPLFPKGKKIGNAWHEVMEDLDFEMFSSNSKEKKENYVKGVFSRNQIDLDEAGLAYVLEMVGNVLGAKLPIVEGGSFKGGSFTLSSIKQEDKKAEIEFNFNAIGENFKNYFNGFIDLILRLGDGRYAILDWKSDSINEKLRSYSCLDDLKSHVDDCYSIQRVLYAYCLIKWLEGFYPNKTKEEIFTEHFGGVYYVFLRGCNKGTGNGVYCQTWKDYGELEKAFIAISERKIKHA